MNSSSYLEAAGEVARLAGDVALRYYRKDPVVEIKADGSSVTIADRAAEKFAREWIEARFPADGILGEEMGTLRPDSPRQWIIDPIDGTESFIRGVPLWGTLVGVVQENEVIAGAAYFPAVGEIVTAATGYGCWWNGARASVSRETDLSQATVLTTDAHLARNPERRPAWGALAARARISRTWGDCYGYLLVATGRAEVMVDAVVSAWDIAAILPIITEAGGHFTDWRGQTTAFGGNAIATNAGVSAEVRKILSQTPTSGES